MDLLATKIALNEHVTQKEIWNLIQEWLIQSPHYNITTIDYNDRDEVFSQEFKNTSISILHFDLDNSHIFACRFTNHEKTDDWFTDIIYVEKTESKDLFIKLSRNSNSFSGDSRKSNKPHIIKKLFENGYVKKDGLFPISDAPIPLSLDKVGIFIYIINGKAEADLPVVYLSYDSFNSTYYSVDPNKLAIKLSGMAHIVIEPNKETAELLKENAAGKNAYNGYIGIYYPGAEQGEILALKDYFRNGILDKSKFAAAIYDRIRQALIYHSAFYNMSWDKLQLAFQRKKYTLRTAEAEQTTKAYAEDKEYINLLESEIKQNEEKIATLTKLVSDQRSTIETLKMRFEATSSICFNTSKIEEFYIGELNDLILNLLSQINDKIPEGTRPKELIDTFLTCNEFRNLGKSFLKQIELALNDKSLTKRNSELEHLGFTITESSHDKAYFKKPQYSFTLAKTPSDNHTTKNTLSNIKEQLDIYKKYI